MDKQALSVGLQYAPAVFNPKPTQFKSILSQPNQVIIHKGQPWVLEEFLLQAIPTLSQLYMRVAARPRYKKTVSPCFQQQAVLPDTGKAWRYGRFNNSFYYAYNNIPDKAPALYRSQLPRQAELVQLAKSNQPATVATDVQASFTNYVEQKYTDYLHCYGHYSTKQQQELAKACAILEFTIQHINETAYDLKKNTLFFTLTSLIQQGNYTYIPHNFRRFKEKVNAAYNGEAIAHLITLPRADNKNAAQYEDSEVESWVYQLRGMGKNFTNMYIIRKIWEVCTLSEKPLPSERWIGTIMQKHQVKYLTAAERFGDKNSLTNFYKGYVPMENALYAGDCWQVDATRFNIIGHKAEDKSTKHIFIIVVRDVHSGDIIGYDFDYAENRWVYTNAIAMAVKTTGYLPYELVLDRFPGHNTEEFGGIIEGLRARKVKVTISSKTTGKQRLERHFSTLQTVFMQDSDFYYGEGIKSRHRYAHRSEAYLASMRKRANAEGFNYDAAIAEATSIVEKYRDTALNTYSRKYSSICKSPKQLHQDSEKPNVIYTEPKTYAYLFGLRKKLQLKNEGLIITEIFKTEFIYRTTDFNIINQYSEVLVCYDLEDLSYCHLYEVSDLPLKKYLGTADEVIRAQGFGPNAQWGAVTKQQAIIKHIEQQRKETLELKKAVGDGYDIITLLTPGHTSKDEYINAENNYLNGSAMSVVPIQYSGDDGFEEDIRDAY